MRSLNTKPLRGAKHDNVRDHVREFEEHLRGNGLASKTVTGYGMDVRYFLVWCEGHRGQSASCEEVSATDVQCYRKHLIGGLEQKPSSVNRRLQSLRRFFGWAVKAGIRKTNPATGAKSVKVQVRLRPVALNESEIQALIRSAGQSAHGLGKRNYALVQTLLQAGLRLGELVNLRIEDVTLYERSGSARVTEGQGGEKRVVPLNVTVRRALAAYLETRVGLKACDPLFVSKQDEPFGLRAVQKVIHGLAAKAKITRVRVTPHTLRHTFAIRFLEENPGRLVELASLLGHDSLGTTSIYSKFMAEAVAGVERSRNNANEKVGLPDDRPGNFDGGLEAEARRPEVHRGVPK